MKCESEEAVKDSVKNGDTDESAITACTMFDDWQLWDSRSVCFTTASFLPY